METTDASTASEPSSLSSRYASQIAGQLGCFDRVIITGSLLDVCHPAALERQLYFANLRCFDLGRFAEPLRDAMRDHAVSLARAAGTTLGKSPRQALYPSLDALVSSKRSCGRGLRGDSMRIG